jgi:branched-chain amino acid transport system substrate-binding protein
MAGQGRGAARLVAVLLACAAAACGMRVDRPADAVATGTRSGAPSGAGADAGGADGAAALDPGSPSGTGGGAATGGGTTGGSAGPAGAGGSGAAPATGTPSGRPIEIGAVGTTSGIIGDQQKGMEVSLQAWAAYVNDHGGVAGRPIHLNLLDDGGDPGRHAAAVRRLIDEVGVVAFVGDGASLTMSAGTPILERAGIPAIGGDSGNAGWFTSPMAFPLNGAARPEGIALGSWAAQHLAQTRLAIYHISEIDIGTVIADQVEAQWKKAGKTVVARGSVALAHPDFTAEILQAKNQHADVVALFADISGCRRFFDAARRQDYHPVFLVASACFQPGLESANDLVKDNLYVGSALEPPNSSLADVVTMRQAMASYAPNFPAARVVADGILPRGWAAGRLFERAVALAGGSFEPKDLVAALRSMVGETLGGLLPPQTYGPGVHPEGSCGKILRWDGAKWTVITPDYQCG